MTGDGVDVEAAVRELVVDLMMEPRGRVSPSVYETGRVVTHAPWLVGHAARLRYLVAAQRSDGGWGGPDGYALVPTLSAVEALLVTVRRYAAGADRVVPPDRLLKAVDRGLTMLIDRAWGRGALPTPDMPAIDLIVPALTAAVNDHLDRLCGDPLEGLDQWAGRRLGLPFGMDGRRLAGVRARLRGGGAVPTKLLHALEVVADVAADAPGISPLPFGSIGASPAATAAWLGAAAPPDPYHPARRYLDGVARQQRGPVPCAVPITVFERAWSLAWLAQAAVPLTVPEALLASLRAATRPTGTPAAPGLPSDADTTSVALYALGRLGVRCEPRSLWAYRTDTHFSTWQGEDGESVTVNAHVLEAFGQYLATQAHAAPRYAVEVDRLTRWLCDRQLPDGQWLDRWHASPFYATACCVVALDRYGVGQRAAAAVDRAVEWVLSSQRADGSWGRRTGTSEETAYAIKILLTRSGRSYDHAVSRAYPYLRHSICSRSLRRLADAPQWHDKDLYTPVLVVRSAVLAATYQAERRLSAAVR